MKDLKTITEETLSSRTVSNEPKLRSNTMKDFKTIIDEACHQIYTNFSERNELGVCAPYMGMCDDTALIQLLEADGTEHVQEIVEYLISILPRGYVVGSNSHTDGLILVYFDEHSLAVARHDCTDHIKIFKMLWQDYRNIGVLPRNVKQKYTVLYLDQFLDRREETEEEIINMLNNKEEILHQLLKMDHHWS